MGLHRPEAERPAPWPSFSSSQAGFTIVEGLVAASLLALALLPLAYVQSSGFRDGVESSGIFTASALAVQLEEQVQNISYTDPRLAATSSYVDPSSTLSDANPLSPDGAHLANCTTTACGFVRQWRITDGSPLPFTKTIDVMVTWSEYGAPHSYVLSTIKAVG